MVNLMKKLILMILILYGMQLASVKIHAFVGITPPIPIPESQLNTSSTIGIDSFTGTPNYVYGLSLPPGTNDLRP
jgi:hypothetical protein